MRSAESIASAISEYIQTLPAKSVSGTQLAQFLKFTIPEFSPFAYGVPKLRAFVGRYVPGIVVVGRSGGDLLYGINPGPELQAKIDFADSSLVPEPQPRSGTPNLTHQGSGTPNSTHQVWKSFSSPNSLWHIYANTETGEVEAIAPGNPALAAPWVVIPPLPPDRHLQFAKSFIETLQDAKQRDALQSALAQPRWWDRIYPVSLQLGLLRHWQFYRRREILKAFAEALKSANIPIRPKPSIHSAPLQPISDQTLPREAEQAKPAGKDERLRRAVLSAVEAMSIAELRNLSIPVGYLVDELGRDG